MSNSAVKHSAGDHAVQPIWPATTYLSSGLEAMIRAVLVAYVASLPFKSLLVIERNGFLLLLGLLLAWCLVNRRLFYQRTPYDVPLLMFTLWVGFTIPFASFPQYSLKEYGKLLQWIVVFYSVLAFLNTPTHRRIFLSVLGLSATVAVAIGLTQIGTHDPQFIYGPFPAEVWFTTYLVMAIPFALAVMLSQGLLVARGVAAMLSGLAILCLLETQSRAGMVAVLVELGGLAWLIREKMARVTAGILAACLIAVIGGGLYLKSASVPSGVDELQRSIPVKTGTASIVHRVDIWKFTLSKISDHWLYGIGYGGLSYFLLYGNEGEVVEPGHTSVKERGTHNILLYLSLHVGIPGMALFVWLYGSAIPITLREYRLADDWMTRGILAGSTVSFMGLFTRLQFDQMFVGSLAVLFWVLLATAIMHYPSQERFGGNRVPG